jgi:hypothetical protein
MKVCKSCSKLTKAFGKDKHQPDGLNKYCYQCTRDKQKVSIEKHKERRRQYTKDAGKRKMQLIFNYLLAHPCIDCQESDPMVLEFDHLFDKEDAPTYLAMTLRSDRHILKEIAKCEVRCANCHTRKTHERRQSYRWQFFTPCSPELAPPDHERLPGSDRIHEQR